MGNGNSIIMRPKAIASVFVSALKNSGFAKSRSKCISPTHGLPETPKRIWNCLNANCNPYIGPYEKIMTNIIPGSSIRYIYLASQQRLNKLAKLHFPPVEHFYRLYIYISLLAINNMLNLIYLSIIVFCDLLMMILYVFNQLLRINAWRVMAFL